MYCTDYLTSWNKAKTITALIFFTISLIGLITIYFSTESCISVPLFYCCGNCQKQSQPKVCPDVPQKPCEEKVKRIFTLNESSYFDFNAPSLRAESEEALENLLKTNIMGLNEIKIELIGHADPIGSDEYNDELSKKRALNVQSFLITHKILEKSQIKVEGKGEREPIKRIIERCDSLKLKRTELIKCYQPLRRVTVRIEGRLDPNFMISNSDD